MKRIIAIFLVIMMATMGVSCASIEVIENEPTKAVVSVSLDEIPEYNGEASIIIDNDIPNFTSADYTTSSYEEYGMLDNLGRCTSCIACIGQDLMPTQKRGSIGMVKPTGWQTAKYDNVDGKYLYNRCHLIGYQLTAENANECNLITGTRYMNTVGMLPYEDEVADYIHETNNHVLYRVTPIFKSDELVARGVQMEAYSIEDNGEGVKFNVYCYNVQPDIEIDYSTGDSKAINSNDNYNDANEKRDYVVNMKSKKFHLPDCQGAKDMNPNNKKKYHGTRQSLIKNGYEPCGKCKA